MKFNLSTKRFLLKKIVICATLALAVLYFGGCSSQQEKIKGNVYHFNFSRDIMLSNLSSDERFVLSMIGEESLPDMFPDLYYKIISSKKAHLTTDFTRFHENQYLLGAATLLNWDIDTNPTTVDLEYTIEDNYIFFSNGDFAEISNNGALLTFGKDGIAEKIGNLYK